MQLQCWGSAENQSGCVLFYYGPITNPIESRLQALKANRGGRKARLRPCCFAYFPSRLLNLIHFQTSISGNFFKKQFVSVVDDDLYPYYGFGQLRLKPATCDLRIAMRAAAGTISAKSSSEACRSKPLRCRKTVRSGKLPGFSH